MLNKLVLFLALFFQSILCLATDKVFIESFCTISGLQELTLHESGNFTITTYISKKLPLKTELEGTWVLNSQHLLLSGNDLELEYIVSNKPIEISGQHMLVAYMEPIKNESDHPLNKCEFTDKRVLKRIIKAKKTTAVK